MKLFLLGGRPCSGKTTLADKLGEKLNIDVIHLDEFARDCIDNSTADHPNIHRWKECNLVELLEKEPANLLCDYINTYEEMLPFLLRKIDASAKQAAILEGAMLLPGLIDAFKNKHVIKTCYLQTDDAFVFEKYCRRDYVQDMIKKPEGKKAVDNLLGRDSLFAGYISDEIEKYALPKLFIHSNDTIELTLSHLEVILELSLLPGKN